MNKLTFLGSNISLVKSHNLRAILLSMLDEGRVARVELAQKTSLSTTTVTNLIAELLEQGIVVEEEFEASERPRRVGRPRTALRLVANARYALGVHIGIGRYRTTLTDLFAQPLDIQDRNYEPDSSPETVLEDMAATIEAMVVKSEVDRQRVLGVGVGASGLVDYQTGINVLAPNLGWRDVPIRTILERRLGLPVTVDNNVRTMALAEAFFGAGRSVNSLAFVYGRIGVGAGFVFHGQVFRGSSAGAGEIGHSIIIAEGGDRCRCGNTGCLETLVSEPVLIRQAELLARQSKLRLALPVNKNDGHPTIEQVFAAARAGEVALQQEIEQRACYLGMALANVVNMLNPELILVGGMFAQGADLFLPVAERTMQQLAFAGLGDKVRVETTSFGWRAGVVGGAALALTNFFYQQPEDL